MEGLSVFQCHDYYQSVSGKTVWCDGYRYVFFGKYSDLGIVFKPAQM